MLSKQALGMVAADSSSYFNCLVLVQARPNAAEIAILVYFPLSIGHCEAKHPRT